MTVPAASRRTSPFLGNGVTTSFPFTFKVFQTSDIAVVVTNTSGALSTKVLNSDYSVTLNPDQTASPGGSITYPLSGSPLATGEKLVIVGDIPYSQTLALPGGGNYNPVALERALDRTEMQIQQVADGVASAVRAPFGETLDVLPDAATRANTVQAYDADGQPTIQVPASGSAADVLVQLADPTLLARGAGLVAHNGTLAYADGTVGAKLQESVSVKDYPFLAVGDGVADDTAAFTAALAVSARVIVPPGTYRLTSTLTLTAFGAELIGQGQFATVQLLIDHTTGHGIRMTASSQTLRNLLVYASTTRQAAATNVALSGIAIGGSAGTAASARLDRVIVRFHPGIGVYLGGACVLSELNLCRSDFNKHHGYALDDGTLDGDASPARCGIVTLRNCGAIENGGNAASISEIGTTCYRIRLEQFEAIGNAWNTGGIALRDAQVVARGQNFVFDQCAYDDSYFANTTTTGGTPRTAKGAASDGLQVMNGTTDFIASNTRYLVLNRAVFVRTGATGLYFDEAYSDPVKSIGFRIESGVTVVRVRLSSVAGYTTPVFSDSAGVQVNFAGVESILAVASGSLFTPLGVASPAIASNAVAALAGTLFVTGQGGVADDLQQIVFLGAQPVPAGHVVRVVNLNAYNITVKNGLTNVFTKTAADVVLGQNKGISFVSNGTNMYEV